MDDLDQARVDSFSQRMTDILNGGMLSLMASIGYQTGLFEVMAKLKPASSEKKSTYPPQGNSRGEVHEHWSFFS
ncbi:MAG: hypothetical protein L0387_21360 [Acidobacteria bacterium]|nr:hypothetical protein [Acidobacteriota bacterium]MCI0719739.1 hypothetical protein [Acidobacteriota bacterium]